MITRFTVPAALAAALALAAPMTVAIAQDAAPVEPAMPAPALDDAKLQSFAMAYLEVGRIVQAAQPRIEATADPSEQEAIRQQANAEMVEAVESAEGITVEEYTAILAGAQTDPDLAQRINSIVQNTVQPD